jgi:hypothetical protein
MCGEDLGAAVSWLVLHPLEINEARVAHAVSNAPDRGPLRFCVNPVDHEELGPPPVSL